MSNKIIKVDYIEGHKLRLYFDDKKIKVVDLEKMLKKAKNTLLPLTDMEYFKRVKCDGITIYWPNGVDFCPDVLYREGKDVTHHVQKRSRSLQSRRIRKKLLR